MIYKDDVIRWGCFFLPHHGAPLKMSNQMTGDSQLPLAVPENNVRRLFKHIFHPQVPWRGCSRLGLQGEGGVAGRFFS